MLLRIFALNSLFCLFFGTEIQPEKLLDPIQDARDDIEKYRKSVKEKRERNRHEGHRDADSRHGRRQRHADGRLFYSSFGDMVRIDFVGHERITKHRVVHDPEQEDIDAVQDDGGFGMQVTAKHMRRERHEGHEREIEHIELYHDAVHVLGEDMEKGVMRNPEHIQHDEADEVGKENRRKRC